MTKMFNVVEDVRASNVITAMQTWRLQCEVCDYFEYSWIDEDGSTLRCPDCGTVSKVKV